MMVYKKGFTLIEILVVLVIMGLLVSIVAPNVLTRVDDARIQKVDADFKTLGTALKTYKIDNYDYPSTEQGLSALDTKPVLSPLPPRWREGGYMEEGLLDPWGRPYLYLKPGESHPYDLYTLGADGVVGGEGQNADINRWKSAQGGSNAP